MYLQEASSSSEISVKRDQDASTIYGPGTQSGGNVSPVKWEPGSLIEVQNGSMDCEAVSKQGEMPLVVFHWHAAWIEACIDIRSFLER